MTKPLFKFPDNDPAEGSAERLMLQRLDPAKMPRHIAIIMDGNGRWARKRGLPRVMGHREGVKSVRAAVENCARFDLEALTIYAFSTENWNRPQKEIDALMKLLSEWLHKEVGNLEKNGIRFKPIGRWRELPPRAVEDLEMAIEQTKAGENLLFQVALNYGGRAEIVDALRSIVASGAALDWKNISEELINDHMYTAGVPDPDLMIRTSGELRISNYLLWQLAYAELYVSDTFWPDFRLMELAAAIHQFQQRDRRFGGLNGDG